VAATMFAGAVAPAAAKKLTALLTTLVTNTVLAAAADAATAAAAADAATATDTLDEEDAAAFAFRTAAALARSPPVVSAKGEAVESSLLIEGVLLSESVLSSAMPRTVKAVPDTDTASPGHSTFVSRPGQHLVPPYTRGRVSLRYSAHL